MVDAADERWRWALLGSLILHALLSLALLIPNDRRSLPLLDEGVAVEVWTEDEFRALAPVEKFGPPVPSSDDAVTSPSATGPAPELPAAPPVGTLIRPTRLLSGAVLSDPLSRQARAVLPSLEQETRLEQLCGLEAMAQIAEWHRQFQPDRVVAYATRDVKVSGRTFMAEGAAFRSDRRWYRLRFVCDIAPGAEAVSAFEFAVGDAIPRSAWERYGLPPVH